MRHVPMTGLWIVLVAATASAQVKNPTAVEFTCPDHAQDTGHEIDIVRVSDGLVIQTIQGGDPPESGGVVRIDINVQPIVFGAYAVVVRALGGALASANSPASDPWERVPGAPSKPVVK